jgi:hypothetical protein
MIKMNGRVSKLTAIKLWCEGKPITFVPCKMVPGGMWGMGSTITVAEVRAAREGEGKTDTDLFNLICDEYRYYNCNWETGYYPAYYVK